MNNRDEDKFLKYQSEGGFRKVDLDSLEKSFKDILDKIKKYDESVNSIAKELKDIKNNLYKDKEIEKLKKELEGAEAIKNDRVSFNVSKDEFAKAEKWQIKHNRKYHGADKTGYVYTGACGGQFSWEFYPTGLGTIASCTCDICRRNKENGKNNMDEKDYSLCVTNLDDF